MAGLVPASCGAVAARYLVNHARGRHVSFRLARYVLRKACKAIPKVLGRGRKPVQPYRLTATGQPDDLLEDPLNPLFHLVSDQIRSPLPGNFRDPSAKSGRGAVKTLGNHLRTSWCKNWIMWTRPCSPLFCVLQISLCARERGAWRMDHGAPRAVVD